MSDTEFCIMDRWERLRHQVADDFADAMASMGRWVADRWDRLATRVADDFADMLDSMNGWLAGNKPLLVG